MRTPEHKFATYRTCVENYICGCVVLTLTKMNNNNNIGEIEVQRDILVTM